MGSSIIDPSCFALRYWRSEVAEWGGKISQMAALSGGTVFVRLGFVLVRVAGVGDA